MKKTLAFKNNILSNEKSLICVPLIGKNLTDILFECDLVVENKPDIVEWRADYIENLTESMLLNILEEISVKLKDYSLIFTLRIAEEGGNISLLQKERIAIIKSIINTKKIDFVDIELVNESDFIEDIFSCAKANNVQTILSNHDFKTTPTNDEILSILSKMKLYNPSISKVAYMPNNISDVLRLMDISSSFSQQEDSSLVIAISMGKLGVISRIGASVFGSCLTFAILKESSAPGQISIEKLKTLMNIL